MPGIFPDASSGGTIVRTQAGVCQNPANVTNGYCPPSTFQTTCDITALPNDCTARITAAQINAFQSEMLCLAATLSPDGTWNCASTCNLSTAFTAWLTGTGEGSLQDAVEDFICSRPIKVNLDPNTDTLIGCDGNGVNYRTTLAALGAELVCALPSKVTVGATDSVVLCDGATGGGVRVPAANLAAASICAAPVLAVPTAGTEVVVCDPSGSLRNVPFEAFSHQIQGAVGFAYADIFGIPPGTSIRQTDNFFVPNSSPFPISVLFHISPHVITQIAAGETGEADFFVRSGPNGTGGIVAQYHTNPAVAAGGTQVTDDISITPGVFVIPPGGATLSVVYLISSSNVGGAPNSNIVSASSAVRWQGFYAAGLN